MQHFDIRKWPRMGYVVLMAAIAITWTGCSPTVPTAVCGNGDVEAGEECDPPNGDTCDVDCTIIEDTEPVCGDSVIDPGEDCDPPDDVSCDADCQTIPVGGAVCGNGQVEAGEDCDPPNSASCDADCQMIPVSGAVCGNDVVEEGERCEPPNTATCDSDCQSILPGSVCGDGVVEGSEQCEPPDSATCDADCQTIPVGGAVCGDGVVEDGEQCEPPNSASCDAGCQTIPVGGTVCGDGVVEGGEQCEPPGTQTCDADCQTIPVGGPVCGNSVVETGEQCDPPDSDTCDANCQTITGGGLANDSCASPTAITEGSRSFSNVGATTDGPVVCDPFGNPLLDSDIWFCFTAPCDEAITVSLCGSAYDTKLAVYLGCECPTSDNLWVGCSDDDCGAGQESRTTFPGIEGQDYLIRVGGFRGFDDEQGVGTLTIFCESDPDHGLATCAPGSGDCFSNNGTPGCSEVALCEATCAADASCCDRLWDGLCATKADGIANGFDACGPTSGSCFENEEMAGCDDTDCCQSVCEVDPFCCLTDWDDVCVDSVVEVCGLFEACIDARGTCFAEHDAPACNDQDCCNNVCAIDPFCCSDTWDDVCTGLAGSCPQ